MFKKSILVLFVLISAVIVTANINQKLSAAAPASSTGGPDENHCSSAGCHDDKTINIGKAKSTIELEDLIDGQFIPGKKYKVKVSIDDPNVNRFGFQLMALNMANKKAGLLENLDESNTQILTNYVELKDREYITYTYKSTLAKQLGKANWEFYWTAPEKGSGDVIFYLGTVSANDDGTDKGDHTFATTLKLSPSATASLPQIVQSKATFVNQKGNELSVSAFIPTLSSTEFYIKDFRGQLIGKYSIQPTKVGRDLFSIALNKTISSGYYILYLEHEGEIISTNKILLTF